MMVMEIKVVLLINTRSPLACTLVEEQTSGVLLPLLSPAPL